MKVMVSLNLSEIKRTTTDFECRQPKVGDIFFLQIESPTPKNQQKVLFKFCSH